MNPESLGKILMGIGIFIAAAGVGLYFFGAKMGGIGRLPGDIAIERGNLRVYFPVTSLLLLNLVIWIAVKIIRTFQK